VIKKLVLVEDQTDRSPAAQRFLVCGLPAEQQLWGTRRLISGDNTQI
jgi:hypothetical protein